MHILGILIYNALFPIGLLLYFPFYVVKLQKRGNWRPGFGERFGWISAAKRRRIRALQRPVWLHAVSVGEAQAALSFIRLWRQREPQRGFVVSTTTATGQQTVRDKAPAGVEVIYFPFDFWLCDLLSLLTIRPTLLVIFEKEVWPTLMALARLRRLPTALVNGIMSPRSHRRYTQQRWLFGPVFRWFDRLCVQTHTDAACIRDIAGPDTPVHVCHTLKFDAVPSTAGHDSGRALLDRVFPDPQRLVLCAASTHPGEEALMLAAFTALQPDHPHLRLLLVPRHHERSADVEADIRAAGLPYVLRSALRLDPDARHDVPVCVVNSTGELMDFIAAADIVYVGKALAGQWGGHNIIEPAIFAKPTITGNRTENFRPVMEAFRADHAVIEVSDLAGFTAAVRRLLDDPAERRRLGEAARACVESHRGAADRTLDLLAAIDTVGKAAAS